MLAAGLGRRGDLDRKGVQRMRCCDNRFFFLKARLLDKAGVSRILYNMRGVAVQDSETACADGKCKLEVRRNDGNASCVSRHVLGIVASSALEGGAWQNHVGPRKRCRTHGNDMSIERRFASQKHIKYIIRRAHHIASLNSLNTYILDKQCQSGLPSSRQHIARSY